ncbi:MAG TPA: N-formylglutamate amidohydrolase [Thermoanaerobaculia bacterium]|nr:N-formylglutamate amidohydrolase [Thermoanaerobaculia bacterium]
MQPALEIVVSCEHAGRRVPARHRALFAGREALLDTHRAWDPGALTVARDLSRRLAAPLFAVSVTRLLVEVNRSAHNPRVWSELSRTLPARQRRQLLERYHSAHWRRVEGAIRERAEAGRRVAHLSSHTFTPVLDGVERRCDVGVLFDPSRPFETELAARLVDALRRALPDLRVRRNAPYRGVDDGLTRGMRRVFPDPRYAGLELEVSQRLPGGPRGEWLRVRRALEEAVAAATR